MTELERLQQRLDLYYAAETAILSGQEYSFAGKSLKRADLKAVQQQISNLKKEIKLSKNGGKNRAFRGVPYDI
ncbi:MAG: DUF6148 family protein [Velocimicrobium sp.]